MGGTSGIVLGGIAEGLTRGLQAGTEMAMAKRRMSLAESQAQQDTDYRRQQMSLQQAREAREGSLFEQQSKIHGLQLSSLQRQEEHAQQIAAGAREAQTSGMGDAAGFVMQSLPWGWNDPDGQKFAAAKPTALTGLNQIFNPKGVKVLNIRQSGPDAIDVLTLKVKPGTDETEADDAPKWTTFTEKQVAVIYGLSRGMDPAVVGEKFDAVAEKRRGERSLREGRLAEKALDVYGKTVAATSRARAAQNAAADRAKATKTGQQTAATRKNLDVLLAEFDKVEARLGKEGVITPTSDPAKIDAHNADVDRLRELGTQINAAYADVNPGAATPLKRLPPAAKPAGGATWDEFLDSMFKGVPAPAKNR